MFLGDGTIGLTGGTTAFEGNVVVQVGEKVGPVCDDLWDINDVIKTF